MIFYEIITVDKLVRKIFQKIFCGCTEYKNVCLHNKLPDLSQLGIDRIDLYIGKGRVLYKPFILSLEYSTKFNHD